MSGSGGVSLAGIPGQIVLGHLSDRIGREFVWAVGSLGFTATFLLLLLLRLFQIVKALLLERRPIARETEVVVGLRHGV